MHAGTSKILSRRSAAVAMKTDFDPSLSGGDSQHTLITGGKAKYAYPSRNVSTLVLNRFDFEGNEVTACSSFGAVHQLASKT